MSTSIKILTDAAKQIISKHKANLEGPPEDQFQTYENAIKKLAGDKIESFKTSSDKLVKLYDDTDEEFTPEILRVEIGMLNQFLMVVHLAFSEHYPLSISPDAFWFLIASSFATHVKKHAGDLQSKFVSHKGKEKITVRRDNFIKGNRDNDWEGCFDEFSAKIRDHIGEQNHQMIVADFSTTGPIEKACSEIVLMDAMQSFFEYELQTMCGIPGIYILGQKEDWEKILHKVTELGKVDNTLLKWSKVLEDVLANFIQAFDGNIDQNFWNSLYKIDNTSGGPFVTGWINTLYLYRRNPLSSDLELNNFAFENYQHSVNSPNQFPKGLSKAPFTWQYLNHEYAMDFIGGIIGATWDSTSQSLVPQFGWAVVESVSTRGDKTEKPQS